MEICVSESELLSLIEASKQDSVKRLVVGIFIVNSAGRILIVKRAPNETFLPNVEEMPGGGVEAGEDMLETVRRETLEETGLRVTKVLRYVNQFDYLSLRGRLTRQFNFLVEVNEGKEITAEDIKLNPTEHDSYRWIGRDDLDGLVLTSEDSGIKQSILDFFNFK